MLVISNGMMRSGSTLQYNIACEVLETRYDIERIGFFGDFAKPGARTRLERLRDQERWSLIKTHEPPLQPAFYTDRVRVLFSYRDVRDIAGSLKKKWGFDFEKILSDIEAMIKIQKRVSELPLVLVQPYELLYRDIARAARQIAGFLNIDIADAEAGMIAKMLSLESVRAKLQKRSRNPLVRILGQFAGRFRVDGSSQFHDNHISASDGRAGDYFNQFSKSEIEILETRFSGWLATHGFEKSPQRL